MQRHNHFSSTKANSFCLIVTKRDVNVAKVFLQDRMILYFVVSFGDVRTWLSCYRKNTNQRCQSMTDRSVFDYITIDIDGVHGVHVRWQRFPKCTLRFLDTASFENPRQKPTRAKESLPHPVACYLRVRVPP